MIFLSNVWSGKKHEVSDFKGSAAILVVSDSLSKFSVSEWKIKDVSGNVAKNFLEEKGVNITLFDVVPDEIKKIRKWVMNAVVSNDVLILIGGTGFSRRDVTPEAVLPLLDMEIPGFGEEFRRISISKIGGRGMLSRAFAGIISSSVIIALPGSKNAVKDGLELIYPVLGHLMSLRKE